MAKKGRPFTYQSEDEKPVTISLRLPKELHTRLERYARQHRQSLSELVKDGIEMRLETEADPRSRRAESTPASPQKEGEYYGNTEESTALLNGASIILREMHEGFAQICALVQALEPQAKPGSNGAYYGNTATEREGEQEAKTGGNTVIQEAEPKRRSRKAKENAPQSDQSPALAEEPVPVAQTHNGNTVIQMEEPKRPGRKPVLREPILALLHEHPAGLTAVELKVYLKTEKHIGDTLAGMVRAQLLVKNGTGAGLRYQRATAEGD